MAWYARPIWAVLFAAVAHGAFAAPAAPAQSVDPIEGVWVDSTKSEITVAPCEEGYCGSISKIVVPPELYAQHKQEIDALGPSGFTDLNNKDPKLRSRPILGLVILTLHPTGKPESFDGTIYDPNSGNTYSGSLQLIGPDTMRLEGCLNVPGANLLKNVLCRDRDWIRAPAEDAADATSAPMAAAPHKHHAAAAAPVSAGTFQ